MSDTGPHDRNVFNMPAYLLWSYVLISILLITRALSTGLYDTGDAISHYQIAKHAPEHPHLFLDHWGKPLFTVLASPFSAFGLYGMSLLNALCAVLTLFLAGKLMHRMVGGVIFLVPVLLLTSPEYVKAIMAGTTEPLFALLATGIVYAVCTDRFFLAAVVTGALPFARPEAVGVIPVVILVMLLNGKWKPLWGIAVVPVLYSFIGWWMLEDPFWILTRDPYGNAEAIYGSGKFLHFVWGAEEILGTVGMILLLAALVRLVLLLIQRSSFAVHERNFIILTLGSSLLVWGIHSWLWWTGTKGSLGLLRVVVTTIPLLVVFTVLLISSMVKPWIPKLARAIPISALVLLTLAGGYSLFAQLEIPLKQWYDQQFLERTAKRIEAYRTEEQRITVQDPQLMYYLDIDPFDTTHYFSHWGLDVSRPDLGTREGDLIVWDAHFSSNEGNLPLEKLQDRIHFTKIASYEPEFEITVLGGHPLSVHVFERRTEKGYLGKTLTRQISGLPWSMNVDTAGVKVIFSERDLCFTALDFPLTIHNFRSDSTAKQELLYRIEGVLDTALVDLQLVHEIRSDERVQHYATHGVETGEFTITLAVPPLPEGSQERLYFWNPEQREFCLRELRHGMFE